MHEKHNKSDSKIKIWFFNQYAGYPNLPGGTRHFDFSSELNSLGADCTIFCSNFHFFDKKTYHKVARKAEIKIINTVRFVFIKSREYSSNNLGRMLNVLSYFFNQYFCIYRIKLDKPQIIVGSSPDLLSALSAYLIARRLRVPFILEIRDIWPQSLVDLGVSKFNPLMGFLRIVELYLYKKSDKIVMLMPGGIDYLKKNKIKFSKSIWISNGVNLKRIKNKNSRTLNKKFFNITFAGTLGEACDAPNLIETARILKKNSNIRINLIGSGVKLNYLKKLKNDLELNNLKIYKPVPKKEIYSILKESDALLFCLKKAPVFEFGNPPNKIFDYMASAKPIVFSSNASNNLVKQANCGISVDASNPQALSQAIIEISEFSPEVLKQLGKNGYNFIQDSYLVKDLSKKYLCLAKDILNKR